MMTPTTAPPGNPDDLATLAHRVERLTISRTNPSRPCPAEIGNNHGLRRREAGP
jgi:hypothetical protein